MISRANIITTEEGNIEINITGKIPVISRKSEKTNLSVAYKELLAKVSVYDIPKIKGKALFHFRLYYPEEIVGYDYDNVNFPMLQDFATAAYLDPPDDTSKRLIVYMDYEKRVEEGIKLVVVPENNIKKYFKEVLSYGSFD